MVSPPDDGESDVEIDDATEPAESSEPHEPGEIAPGARPRAHLLAFAAGRGGTGRSLIAANIAVYLAQTGKKVVAIDADPAGGPLHQLLGASRPPRGFGEFLRGRAEGLTELIVDTPIAGLGLIGGEGSTFGASRPKQTAKGTLSAIRPLDVDYVNVDLGPADS